ncbi:MAG: hypothetical protein H0X08_02635 [Blastocatellia bacterium]|nr:hypothetical protein [Blastocatellia bacterium]
MNFLTGSTVTRVFAQSITSRQAEVADADSVFISLKFADGSNGTIAYIAEGDDSLPKERVEIYGGRKTFVIDDFRRASMHSGGKESVKKLLGQDKGQAEQMRAVCECVISGGDAPIALDDLAATTRTTFRILDSLRTSEAMDV